MYSQVHEGIKTYHFETFGSGVCQAVFTRQGGVSPEPWAELNLGSTVGDDLANVRENRRRALKVLGRDDDQVFDVWQVHGNEVVIAERARGEDVIHQKADAILTAVPGLTLMMRFADCVPIFLHDPQRKVAGIVHAGWLGTVGGVVREAILAMKSEFGCEAGDIVAGIGPSIGPDHYEVGEHVIGEVRLEFGAQAGDLLLEKDGHVFFDLWKANAWLMEQLGVKQIETAGICTACHLEDWYSHRGEHGRSGRFGAIIGLD